MEKRQLLIYTAAISIEDYNLGCGNILETMVSGSLEECVSWVNRKIEEFADRCGIGKNIHDYDETQTVYRQPTVGYAEGLLHGHSIVPKQSFSELGAEDDSTNRLFYTISKEFITVNVKTELNID